jgi:hypothetical protein
MSKNDTNSKSKEFYLVKRLIVYSSFISLIEFCLGIVFGYVSFASGVLIGLLGVIIGMISIITYRDKLVAVGRVHLRTGYMLRYILYASLFLLAAITLKDPVQALLGVFVGMINLKIVIFLFAWRWKL